MNILNDSFTMCMNIIWDGLRNISIAGLELYESIKK